VVLAQARRPRLSERSTLAQTTDSRLGETTTVALGEFAGARFGEAISPEQDGLSLKNQFTHLSEYTRNTSGRVSATLAWAR